MAEIIKLRNDLHEEVQQLLPWLVNGTLDVTDLRRVEGHLAECSECQAELAAERQLAAAIESSPIDSEEAWERMERRLEIAARSRPPLLMSLLHKRVPLRWVLATPVALAAALAVVIVNQPALQPVEPQYHALGAANLARPANLVVQFQPATRVSDMQHALETVDARLVDGPTETGAYLIHVDQARRELALKRLRDNRTIALAQPIDGPERE